MNAEIKKRIEMINRGEVPEGYKKTKIGIIPEDWEIKTLSDINTIETGATPLRSNKKYFNGNIPWVKTMDLNNSYIFDTEEKITELAMKETSLKYVEKNSILIAMYGGFNQIGRTGLMKIRGTTNQAISSIFVDEVSYNSEYILHWLNLNRIYWKKFAASSRKDPNITKRDVQNFPIIKIRYSEQKKIAQILSTWDQAIELKEKLIEEKKTRKKGLMQKLFTGELRLPGFNQKWLKVRLGEVAEMSSGGTPKSTIKKYYDGDIPWVTISDMTNNGKYIDSTERNISQLGLKNSSAKLYPKGTVLYAMYASIGECSIAKVELTSNQAILGIRPSHKLHNEFLYYYLTFIKERVRRQGQQGTQSNLNAGMVKGIKIPLPDIQEQKAIAQVLSTADKEIELLEKELEQLKLQKKGLMQLLLTGIVRVKP